MILSTKWLSDYVNITDIKPRDFSEAMTMSGSKVEGYEIFADKINNVVIGKVLSVERHPDADKLVVCSIDVNEENPLQIVTGAKNVNVGDIVPVAKNNSILPNGTKITSGKLRGVLSEGMLCSLGELGLTVNDYPYAIEDGIFIIKEPCKIGQNVSELFGFDDVAVEFEITPNRPDCLSVIGLAREASATFGRPINIKETSFSETNDKIDDYLSVKVCNKELCPKYCARVIKNVKIEPSPAWLRERLRASGVRPINNIVDITNYVMIEYGQPMHAFDYACIDGKTITVRNAYDGEIMNTLDSQERALKSSNLVIADNKKPVAVAGVMGGENSEIKDTTKTIVFESATFDPTSVRLTSKSLGLRTESSARFEKGLDPNNAIPALNRACELIEMLGAGEIVSGVIEIGDKVSNKEVEFSSEFINRFLGTDISESEMISILSMLDIKVDGGKAIVPSYRADVEDKADIAEEIARIFGYDNIDSTMFKGIISRGGFSEKQKIYNKIDSVLRSCGLYEIATYSFISPKYYDKIMLPSDNKLRNCVTITNPLGEDTSVMRTTLLPSMLEVLSKNINYRNQSVSLYEIGTVYIKDENDDKLPDERNVISIGMYGKCDFFTLKGILEEIFSKLNTNEISYENTKDDPSFHPGRYAVIKCGDIVLGKMGEIHPLVMKNYSVNERMYCALIDINSLISILKPEKVYNPLPKFPASSRDISIVCDKGLPVANIEKLIKECSGEVLESLTLFDVYTGQQIEENKKSVSYSLSFRSAERTLSDEEIDGIMNKIFTSIEKIGGKLR